MLRSLLRLGGAVALAALIAPIAPSAAPAPGLAYDEIVRVVVGATPPPPGNFQADLAAVTTASDAATPTPAPRRGIGFGNIAKAVLGGGGIGGVAGSLAGDAASNAMDNAMEQSLGAQYAALGATVRGFLQPHALHYAYYNGWERVDDLTAKTATIRKCDMAQVYKLDLAKKTYSVYDPASEPTPAAAAPPAPRAARPQPAGAPAPPGTAVADLSTTAKSLGPLKFGSLNTAGYDSTAAFSVTQATGSCRNATVAIKTDEYFSAYDRPIVSSCPVRRAPIPVSAGDVVAPAPQTAGGCRPTLTFHTSGPALPAGKLSLYTLVTMNGSGPSPAPAPAASGADPGGIGFLTERGNLQPLSSSDTYLFTVPGDFTKTP